MPEHKKRVNDSTKVKKKARLSPYYKSQKRGGAGAAITKRDMASYFRGSKANRRGESESQHMKRMAKIDKSLK